PELHQPALALECGRIIPAVAGRGRLFGLRPEIHDQNPAPYWNLRDRTYAQNRIADPDPEKAQARLRLREMPRLLLLLRLDRRLQTRHQPPRPRLRNHARGGRTALHQMGARIRVP